MKKKKTRRPTVDRKSNAFKAFVVPDVASPRVPDGALIALGKWDLSQYNLVTRKMLEASQLLERTAPITSNPSPSTTRPPAAWSRSYAKR